MQVRGPNLQCVLGLWAVLKNVIPRFLGQIPVSGAEQSSGIRIDPRESQRSHIIF